MLQLAILPGNKKQVKKDIDSYLQPIFDELRDLEQHGMVVETSQGVYRAKIHLLLCSGDIPAVAAIGHFKSHNSRYGCRICESVGEAPDNRSAGMYF